MMHRLDWLLRPHSYSYTVGFFLSCIKLLELLALHMQLCMYISICIPAHFDRIVYDHVVYVSLTQKAWLLRSVVVTWLP